jgi:hypothetical protein
VKWRDSDADVAPRHHAKRARQSAREHDATGRGVHNSTVEIKRAQEAAAFGEALQENALEAGAATAAHRRRNGGEPFDPLDAGEVESSLYRAERLRGREIDS